jgi:UDP-N-acetylmuramoylalanine--D-glutamate ligase
MKGKRVLVMGLGKHGGGVGVARWLARRGCRVTITDLATKDDLAESLAALADVRIEKFLLGGHDSADFRRAEWIVVNPAVTLGHHLLAAARAQRKKITSEIELFLEHCPATVIGVTGTTGKSTTCAMLAEIFRHAGRCTWLGGNIGHSLLDELRFMHASDIVIAELSSFQLAHLSRKANMPRVAVVTNCTPNHLDWHGGWDWYVAAKQRIVTRKPEQIVVLNQRDRFVRQWCKVAGVESVPLVDASHLPELWVPGEHNRQNAVLAATVATMMGVDGGTLYDALGNFRGLPHRLALVQEVAGRRFYNDSKATSPAATEAALASVKGPTWLLAGGSETHQDWHRLARQVTSTARGAIFFGASRKALHEAVKKARQPYRVASVETLADAVALAFERSQPGDCILLSPACPSFDQFADFAERGRLFEELVHALAASTEGSTTLKHTVQ